MNVLTGQTALPMARERQIKLVSALRLFSTRRLTSLTIALLVVVALASTYGIIGVVQRHPITDQIIAWSACGSLVGLAIVVLLIGRYMVQRSLLHIEQQLRVLTREGWIERIDTPAPDELKPVMSALGNYIEYVRSRVDRLNIQKKELDIQTHFADAERRHTKAIIFSISEAVLVVDSFGDLVLANTAAEKLFNFRLEEWRNRPIERVLEDNSLVALIKDSRDVGDLNVRRQVEYSAIRDGKMQTFNITFSTVVDADGQSHGVVAVFHDITREREIAQIKSDFVSAVSHELRTPLSSIKAYVEMLVDGEAHDEEVRGNFYKIIESETDRLQRLITNILNISRIESGVVEIHRDSLQPNDVVKDVCEMMVPQARENEITLDCELSESPPCIHADKDLLYQAVLNVVSNAIKYTQQGGLVSVKTGVEHEAGYFTITVKDNGMGISAKDLPCIFDKFYRSKESKETAKGTGLGLNLVKHIVESVHQGEIAVASECGVGTMVALRFPMLIS